MQYIRRMTWEELLGYCLAKPGAWQDEPWDTVVSKLPRKDRPGSQS